jgi:hypothetical protein
VERCGSPGEGRRRKRAAKFNRLQPRNCIFTGGGEWSHGRINIADFLGLHSDELERCGRRLIAARREKEGLPSEVPASQLVRQPRSTAPLNLAGLVATLRLERPRQINRAKGVNPFSPFREWAKRA